MKIQNVLNCSFDQWYDSFKHVTIKSKVIAIDDEVLKYLQSDETFIMPESCYYKKSATKVKRDPYDTDDSDVVINSDDDFDETDESTVKRYNFPEFDNSVKNGLESFNNKAFLKLNWSSPKDAYWSLNKLSCENLRDVYMLLKSSEFISHDLNQPFDKCDENSDDEKVEAFKNLKYTLVFRKWVDVNPSGEFRCFVRDNKLVGISQRECRAYYKYMNENAEKLTQLVKCFYTSNIHGKFHDASFTFDVYIKKNDSILLLDFNPYGLVTDSLLFDWTDFEQDHADVVFRCIESGESNKITENQYSTYQVPRDISEIVQSGDTEKLLDMIKMQFEHEKKEED